MSIPGLHTILCSTMLAALLAAVSGGCARTFLLSKDCRTYFFGSDNQAFIAMLCGSGDLRKVLADAGLPEQTGAGLYEAQCTERNREKLDRVYASLNGAEQDALKAAFRRHGYEINAHPAPNYRVYPDYDNANFCPPAQY